MEWPNNAVARLLATAYEKHVIEVVTVSAISVKPLMLTVSYFDDMGRVYEFPKLALPNVKLLTVETWLEELCWVTGGDRLTRIAKSDKHIAAGIGPYHWVWVSTYLRATVPMIAEYVASSDSIDSDGGRSGECPYFGSATLLEASKMYPPAGTGGDDLITEIIFSPKKE